MVQVKVYDYDPAWDVLDGADERGAFVLRDIDYKSSDGTIVLKNGTRSHTYEIVQPALICELCRPDINPLCTKECQEACPMVCENG